MSKHGATGGVGGPNDDLDWRIWNWDDELKTFAYPLRVETIVAAVSLSLSNLQPLRHKRKRIESFSCGVSNSISYRRRNSNDRRFPRSCRWDILSVQHDDLQLRDVAKPGNTVC